MSNRCEFCNTPVQVKGDTTKHYESDYDRVCAELEKERAMVDMLAEALESSRGWVVTHAMQTYSTVASREVEKIDDALAKLKAHREGR